MICFDLILNSYEQCHYFNLNVIHKVTTTTRATHAFMEYRKSFTFESVDLVT